MYFNIFTEPLPTKNGVFLTRVYTHIHLREKLTHTSKGFYTCILTFQLSHATWLKPNETAPMCSGSPSLQCKVIRSAAENYRTQIPPF